MNSFAEYILYFYLIVFISILFFDVICLFFRKFNDIRISNLEIKIKKWIELENDIVSKKHCKLLVKKLKRISYFIAFTHVIEQMNNTDQEKYLTQIRSVFFSIYSHYEKQEIIRLTYFVNFLSNHVYIYNQGDNNLIIQFLLRCTTSSSVYLRENALSALYATGKVSCVKEAFDKMNYLNVTHNYKLLTDGLLKFKGDVEQLTDMLINKFDSYNENYKVAIINYFSYKKVNCSKYVLSILMDEKESKEVRIACIRYFAVIPCDDAFPILCEFLKDDKKNWEYAAIASSSLRKYSGKETIKCLTEAIQSHNWYVRNNAAASLIEIAEDNIVDLITNKIQDKYAKEALTYQLYLKGE